MGRPFKMTPNKKAAHKPEAVAKRKAKAQKRAHRRGTVAQITWNAGAKPAGI